MLVPAALLIGGGIMAYNLMKKKTVQESPVTEKPSQLTTEPPRITSTEQFMKSSNVEEKVKSLIGVESNKVNALQNILSQQVVVGAKYSPKFTTMQFISWEDNLKKSIEFLGPEKLTTPPLVHAPVAPRITSIEQALKSKWVTKEAKVLIKSTIKREPGKIYPAWGTPHEKLSHTLRTGNVTAIRMQVVDKKTVLVFEKSPHQWETMNPSKKASIIGKTSMIMGGPGVMPRKPGWGKPGWWRQLIQKVKERAIIN